MPNLEGLPSELLLSVARYLPQSDLYSLASTCRKLLSTAEDILYDAPVIGMPYSEEYQNPIAMRNRVFIFAQTLLHHPRLASKVRLFSVSASKGGAEFTVHPDAMSLAAGYLREIGLHSPPWANRVGDWMRRLNVGDGVAWTGLILAIIPKLCNLTIEILSDSGFTTASTYDSYHRYRHEHLEGLFGYLDEACDPASLLPPDLTAILGLRRLETLYYLGYDIASSWVSLPKLQTLKIAHEGRCPDLKRAQTQNEIPSPGINVQNVVLEVSTLLLNFNPTIRSGALEDHFLSSSLYPRSREVKLYLNNQQYNPDYSFVEDDEDPDRYHECIDIIETPGQGEADMLLNRMIPLSRTLPGLRIDVYKDLDSSFLHYVSPFSSFCAFEALTLLSLPQLLLLGADYGVPGQQHQFVPIYQLLPRTLEYLEITSPYTSVVDWLEELRSYSELMPQLENVTLVCSDSRGDPYPALRSHIEVWAEEAAAPGFCVQVFWSDRDLSPWRPQGAWSHDCDPYVMRLVRYLERPHIGK